MNITLSIVSHNDGQVIRDMIRNTADLIINSYSEIIIRENSLEYCTYLEACVLEYPNIKLLYNTKCCGFGENHNLNFQSSNSKNEFFIVCNPDLKSIPNITPHLAAQTYKEYYIGTAKIKEYDGSAADFMRTDINWGVIVLRYVWSRKSGTVTDPSLMLWAPSVFTVFSRPLYTQLSGYDENIFMYYEDYDICRRSARYSSIKLLNAEVEHIGRRSSRKSFLSFRSHIKSIFYVLNKKKAGEYVS